MPTPSAATASTADVTRSASWPSQANRAYTSATVIARDHNDVVPDDIEILVTLPGVELHRARGGVSLTAAVPVVDTRMARGGPRPFAAALTPKMVPCDHADVLRCCRNLRWRSEFFGRTGVGRCGTARTPGAGYARWIGAHGGMPVIRRRTVRRAGGRPTPDEAAHENDPRLAVL